MPEKYKSGVFYPSNVNIWPHEKVTAETLAKMGYYVEFRPISNKKGEHTADCYINGELWELKAPNGKKIQIIKNNLRRGKKQCDKIVFDSHRIKNLPDKAVERELRARLNDFGEINKIMFINKRRKSVDISRIV